MSDQHTPGPWSARKTNYEGHASGAWYIHAPNGTDARSPCVAHIKRSTIQPMAANARLIAAAPELLAFAQFVLKGIASGSIKASPFMDMDPNAASLDLKTVGGYAAEVIAKATGSAA